MIGTIILILQIMIKALGGDLPKVTLHYPPIIEE